MPHNQENSLILAVNTGNIQQVVNLLAQGVDPNFKHSTYHMTALMEATQEGHKEIVKALLDNGAKVNDIDVRKYTPLHFAALSNKRITAKILLNHGANINALDNLNRTPLSIAVTYGKLKLAQTLLGYQADINLPRIGGFTPLMIAVYSKNTPIVQLLLNNGADLTPKNRFGHTALDIAEKKGYTEIQQLLTKATEKATKQKLDNDKHTARIRQKREKEFKSPLLHQR